MVALQRVIQSHSNEQSFIQSQGHHKWREEGFTLFEVIVAMVVFTSVVMFALGVTLKITQGAAANSQRVTAVALANKEVESIRLTEAAHIQDGLRVRTTHINNVTYTVSQTSTYVSANANVTICAGTGDQLAFKRIRTVVTWPNMNGVKPVTIDTLRAVNMKDEYLNFGNTGVAAITVTDTNSQPVAGVLVDFAGKVVTTGSDGCAVIIQVEPGTYSATLTRPGYTSTDGTTSVNLDNVTIKATSITRASVTYAAALDITASIIPATGYSLPAEKLPVSIRSTYTAAQDLPDCATVTNTMCVSGANPYVISKVFPAVYDIWLGSCADASSGASFTISSQTRTAALPLAHVTVDVQSAGTSVAGVAVYATHTPDPNSCDAGESYTLPVTAAGGSKVMLPYGTWTFSTNPGGTGTTANLAVSQQATTVVVPQ